MLSTLLDLLGLVLIAAFAGFIWPPAALGVVGVGVLVISWRASS